MAKRLTDTDKWKDDWYVSLNNDYRIIWQWLLDSCSHAGVCKRSLGILNMMCKTNISEEDLIREMSGRVIVSGGNWFIPNFLKFQYIGLHSDKPVIVSVRNELFKTGFYLMIPESFGNDYLIIKDKSKDKSICITEEGLGETDNLKINQNGKTKKPFVNFKAQGEEIALRRIKNTSTETKRRGK